MSTRATYLMERDGLRSSDGYAWKPITCLYIHHDGYPEGAAAYLYNALLHPNQRGHGAEQMLRANDGAEITRSHDAHGDTEYRYTVFGWGPQAAIKAEGRKWGRGEERERWEPVFGGTLAAFIDHYAKTTTAKNVGMIDNYSPFKPVKRPYSGEVWLNATTARARLESGPLHHLRIWGANPVGSSWSANWQSCVDEALDLVAAFPDLDSPEIREFAARHEKPVYA